MERSRGNFPLPRVPCEHDHPCRSGRDIKDDDVGQVQSSVVSDRQAFLFVDRPWCRNGSCNSDGKSRPSDHSMLARLPSLEGRRYPTRTLSRMPSRWHCVDGHCSRDTRNGQGREETGEWRATERLAADQSGYTANSEIQDMILEIC